MHSVKTMLNISAALKEYNNSVDSACIVVGGKGMIIKC